MKRNPKQIGTNLFDCIPQKGFCPNQCNQCFYNHAFYLPIDQSHFPTLEEVGDGVVRVNSGHDSNIDRNHVIESTKQYPKRFFNTSIPEFDFPAPVVFTANPVEEEVSFLPNACNSSDFEKIMFVRLRVSSTNLLYIFDAAIKWSQVGIPVVLTFMRYFNSPPDYRHYEFRKSIENDYWCPTEIFMVSVMQIAGALATKTHITMCMPKSEAHITMCGTPKSSYCRDCLNCEKYYYRAI